MAGVFPFRMKFSDATADADPGAGYVRLNQIDQSAATFMYVSDKDKFLTDIQEILRLLDDGDPGEPRSVVILQVPSTNRAIFVRVEDDETEASGYHKFPISVIGEVGGANPLGNDEDLELSFMAAGNIAASGPTGDPGATGPQGGQGIQGPTGPQGPPGIDGAAAAQGDRGPVSGGFLYKFSTTVAIADPGQGKIRLNNADPTLADTLIVDDVTDALDDIQGYLRIWEARGIVILQSADPTDGKGAVYEIESVLEQSGFFQIAVNYVATIGTPLSDTQDVTLHYTPPGPEGAPGADGTEGTPAGFSYQYSSNTTISGVATPGGVRLNNGTIANVTHIGVADVDQAGNDNDLPLDSPVGLRLILWKPTEPSKFAVFRITAVSDAGTYHDLTVTFENSSGSFTNGDLLLIQWSPIYLSSNADISATAAIARSKIAPGTANRLVQNANGTGALSDAAAITAARALISDANGIPTHSTVTTTELQLLSGQTALGETTRKNRVINAAAKINQRAINHVANRSNGDHIFDQWVFTGNGANIVSISNNSAFGGALSPPAGSSNYARIRIQTTNVKFGVLLPVEFDTTVLGRGLPVSLSFYAATDGTNSISAIRAAVVSWSSTADACTRTIVATGANWAAAGTNPTLASNWSYIGTPVALSALTTSWQRYTLPNVGNVPSNANNLGVFIWTDDVVTTALEELLLTGIKLEYGSTCTAYEEAHWDDDMRACQRFYVHSFPEGTAPAQNVGSYDGALMEFTSTTDVDIAYHWRFPQTMAKVPGVTTYNPRAADANWRNHTNASTETYVLVDAVTTKNWTLGISTAPSAGVRMYIHAAAFADITS